nr:hypothetical protein [Tanacetum cinerariifolium]
IGELVHAGVSGRGFVGVVGSGRMEQEVGRWELQAWRTDKALVYDSNGSAEVHDYDNCYNNEIFNMFTQEEQYTELLEPIPEPHQIQQNDSNVIFVVSIVEQDGKTVEQHPETVEETRAYFESLYKNLAIEVGKVNTIERLQAQLGDQKAKSKDTPIDPRKTSREDKFVSVNKVRASVRINPITVSQPHVITKKDVNSDSNGLSSTRVDNTTKTRRPQSRSNAKNDRNDPIIGLPKFKYHKEHMCPSCEQEKSKRASHLPKPVSNSKQMLHLIHMDLCGPMRIASINGKRCSIIHHRFGKTPYELINDGTPDISFLHVFGDLYYPKNDREDIGKLGAKETMNVTFDELSDIAYEQSYSKPGLQSMNSEQINSRLDLTYAPSTIATQQPTERDLDLLFEAMYDDYFGGQPSAATRTVLAAQAPQVLQTPTTSITIADTAPTPKYPSSQATNIPNTSPNVDELETQQHVQQPNNQAPLQPETVVDNVPNAMFDGNMFVNPFSTQSTRDVESSYSQYVDPSNMHTFNQPYLHEYQ